MGTSHRQRVGRAISLAIAESNLTSADVAKGAPISRVNLLLGLVGDRAFTTDELVGIGATLGKAPSEFLLAAEAVVAA